MTVRFITAFVAGLCLGPVFSVAEPPGFPEIYNSQEEAIPLLKPEEALERIQLPPGFEATLFAAEPDVNQPIAMAFDARGRLWVAENYTYAESALNFDSKLRDRILIFEDTDQDGRFNRRTVFWDQAEKLTSVAVGFGGVFALCPPHFLFIPDHDRDDVPDGAPEVLLDGFDHDKVRHTLANGLKFGPDGWLYGRHGIQATSFVGAPGSERSQRTPVNGCIWRYHPTRKVFEVVAQGTTNPWGSDWDEHGELFFINTVIGHLWHAVPGAYFKRMYGEPFNRHVYEQIDQAADHVHWDTREAWNDINGGLSSATSHAGGGHAHTGLMLYQGDNWPEAYRNRMFTLNFHGKRINSDHIERQGAGYIGRHAADFMTVDDPWFRGIELLSGPDGGAYVADWSDIGECHDHNGVHRTSGRIYRITYGQPDRQDRGDLAKRADLELVQLQRHRNDWVVRQARQVLQERAAEGREMRSAHAALLEMFETEDEPVRELRALWALHASGGVEADWLLQRLGHPNEHIRVWAIRLLMDDGTPSALVIARFTDMARKDESGLVLSYLASAMQKMPPDQRWPLAEALVSRAEFDRDPVLPLMVWYGIEPSIPRAPDAAVRLIAGSHLSKIRALAARRLFIETETDALAAEGLVSLLGSDERADLRADVLDGLRQAIERVQKPQAPKGWAEVVPGLIASADQNVRMAARELDAWFGNAESQAALASLAADAQNDLQARRRGLDILLKTRAGSLAPLLKQLLSDPEMTVSAIRALATAGESETPALLLSKFPEMPPAARREVVNALVSRPSYAAALLEAVQRGRIARTEISAGSFRELRSHDDPAVKEKIAAIWPQSDRSPNSVRESISKFTQLLTPARLHEGALDRGREVFRLSCAPCHKLYGEGAEIGPELTGSDRHNLEYLLENILNPSGIVADNYRVSMITMKDEQVLSGILLSRTANALVLQTVSETMTLAADEVESVQESQLSMMPDGLMDSLNERQIIDLMAYLMSRNP